MRNKFLLAIVAMLFFASGLTAMATPYAVYCEGDFSLHLLDSATEPTVGSTLESNSQKITKVWEIDLLTSSSGSYSPWSSASQATKVIIEDSFQNVRPTKCSYWFYDFKTLTEIEGLPNLITEEVTYMDYMFYGCSGLTSIDLSNFKTDNVLSMLCMFRGCSNLTSIDVSTFKTEKVTNMNALFAYCSGLTSLDVSNFNTENVGRMNVMFAGCSGLTSLDLTNFITTDVFDMSSMFENCSQLTTLKLSSNFDTTNVTDMSKMFAGCSSLTSLPIGNFNTTKVTKMNDMFYGCSGLTSLAIDDFDTAKVTNMSNMFYGCSGLTSLAIGNFDTTRVTDMNNMFSGCSGLTSLAIDNFNTAKVTNMKGMFHGCSGLTSLKLSSNFSTSNVTNMSDMFHGCSGLTSLDLPNNFNTTKVTDMSKMFYSCNGLTSLDFLNNFDTANVTNMEYMFCDCTGLTSIDVSNFHTENVMYMTSMFNACNSLISIDLMNFNTEKVFSMSSMFASCDNLTSLDIRNFNTENVTYLDMFGTSPTNSSLRIVDLSQSKGSSKLLSKIPGQPLIFVPEDTAVTDDKVNVIVGTSCNNLVIDYTDSFYHQLLLSVPYTFTANQITIKRKFNKNQPYTLYLPFAMNASQYGTFYTNGKLNASGSMVTFDKVIDEQTSANIPYMFMPVQDFPGGITIESEVAVSTTPEDTEADGLNGVYEKKVFSADDASQKIYYGWAGGDFCWAEEGATVDACRAYFKLPANAAAKAPARIKAVFGEDSTGVNGIDSDADGINAPIYNLNGQRAGEDYKGILIKKGIKTANFSR